MEVLGVSSAAGGGTGGVKEGGTGGSETGVLTSTSGKVERGEVGGRECPWSEVTPSQ